MRQTTGEGVVKAASHLPEEIARELERRISASEFKVGSRLPSERELSLEFSVSRPVIREALSQLKQEGLVEARAGSGVFVIDKTSTRSFRVQPVVIEEARSLEQLMELLVTIEVAATRIAARNRTEDDLKKIKRALIGMEYAIASDRLGDEEDYAFHDAIVAATHNPHFIALCKHLEFGARHVIRQARANTRAHLPDLLEAVQKEHQDIFEAVKDADAEAAGEAAERHLRNASERMMIYLAAKEKA
jgi:GntR family transcriptional regulator, transcriptional repressor for pyruvate dehydrogenase complex